MIVVEMDVLVVQIINLKLKDISIFMMQEAYIKQCQLSTIQKIGLRKLVN